MMHMQRLAVLEYVCPPAIFTALDAHMVWNDIENLPHAVLFQLLHEQYTFFRVPISGLSV
jgi:hypothetical protein